MPNRISRFACLSTLLLLGACAASPPRRETPSRSGLSSAEIIPSDAARRYTLQPGDTVEQPALVANPAPTYPLDLLGKNLDVRQFAARLVVTVDGTVEDCIPLDAAADPADLDGAVFFEAIRTATRNWHFTPLRVTRLEDVDDNGDGEVDRVVQRPPQAMPFSLDYRFRFAVVDGKPQVEQTGHR